MPSPAGSAWQVQVCSHHNVNFRLTLETLVALFNTATLPLNARINFILNIAHDDCDDATKVQLYLQGVLVAQDGTETELSTLGQVQMADQQEEHPL